MTRMPTLKPAELIAALKRTGYVIDHQSGSHVVLYKAGAIPISVPLHNRDMKKGTLLHILRATEMSVDELIQLLR